LSRQLGQAAFPPAGLATMKTSAILVPARPVLIFVAAVFVPSLVLAWLAVRSLRDQQFLLERQQSLLYQGLADNLARTVLEALSECKREFETKVAAFVADHPTTVEAGTFDRWLRQAWPLAQVGFVVSPSKAILSPRPDDGAEARKFLADNSRFLANRESAEVYLDSRQLLKNLEGGQAPASTTAMVEPNVENQTRYAPSKSQQQTRNVIPQQRSVLNSISSKTPSADSLEPAPSKVATAEAEFQQLMGDAPDGTLSRFVDNRLSVLVCQRPSQASQVIFGAQLNLSHLQERLRPLAAQVDPALADAVCVALLDDLAKPLAVSRSGFQTNWKRPFVATEIGETLPHWEAAVYLVDPGQLARAAQTVKLTLGLLIAMLVVAIGIGSWLIMADLRRQLALARQKTDFVSNVSHELKTPLTSIRMFAELLADGRVTEVDKQRSYLGIITAEAARLTRLINNVLDFARLERGEKKYHFQPCDLVAITREAADSYRPHLEANGFKFEAQWPAASAMVNGDRDSLAQVLVNLLSNAEKYSGERKEIAVSIELPREPLPYVEVKVLDRGLGVPHGAEEKIFEKFYRAHDSLSSGIQGSGLGLTLARQIARAHSGEVVYQPHEGGGSCFSLRLPLRAVENENQDSNR
jgi:signal transduction histidine kinase